MALEQRKFQTSFVREIELPEVPRTQPRIRPSRKVFSVGEKFLFMLFAAVLVILATMILHTHAQINETNRDVQIISKEIDETTKKNAQLAIQVKEKSTYERIWGKAQELGLNLNENNVKVVPGR